MKDSIQIQHNYAHLTTVTEFKKKQWKWTGENDKAFQKTKKIQEKTQIQYFKKKQTLRNVCGASRDGLGAILHQKTQQG